MLVMVLAAVMVVMLLVVLVLGCCSEACLVLQDSNLQRGSNASTCTRRNSKCAAATKEHGLGVSSLCSSDHCIAMDSVHSSTVHHS